MARVSTMVEYWAVASSAAWMAASVESGSSSSLPIARTRIRQRCTSGSSARWSSFFSTAARMPDTSGAGRPKFSTENAHSVTAGIPSSTDHSRTSPSLSAPRA
jgi:hypothetical protein